MYYASIGILALILHFIINHGVFRRKGSTEVSELYRQFMICITIYYVSDVLWGFFEASRIVPLEYADTVLYFASMALTVPMWTRYVSAYLNGSGIGSKAFRVAGWLLFGYGAIVICINFFHPILFDFSADGTYYPYYGRYIGFALQIALFSIIAVCSLIRALKRTGKDRTHYVTVSVSGFVMTALVLLQTLYPFLPYYSVGCLIATCLIHVFVEEDEKTGWHAELSIYNDIADSLALDYEAVFHIDIETGAYREVAMSKHYEEMQVPKYSGNFYEDAVKNVMKYVYPEDVDYALNFYSKENMIKNLEGRNTFSYKYRLSSDEEPKYYYFVLMYAEDKKHFIFCEKDISREIRAEKELREKYKKSVTFGELAESLASNYDEIYYVDTENSDYVAFSTSNIYGQLEIENSGEDFFADVTKNLAIISHPKDREKMEQAMDRDHLISVFEEKREFSVEYRLIINEEVKHMRLSVRRTTDKGHFIIGVENIDDEVIKEREHLKALNTEKELARRDELTGTKNKTAYTELEKSVQNNIDNGMDYLPFGIVLCDINDLKTVNDTKGHKAGDDYIKSAAKLLCNVFDHSPVFRVGGDEFVIFLRGNDYENREELLSGLKKTIMDNRDIEDEPVIAVGMSEYKPGEDFLVSDVFERADELMYENKRALKGV